MQDQRMSLHRLRHCKIFGPLGDAEIGGGEQLLDQDHLRALGRCLPDQALGAVDVGGQIPRTGELRGGDGHLAHGGSFRRFRF